MGSASRSSHTTFVPGGNPYRSRKDFEIVTCPFRLTMVISGIMPTPVVLLGHAMATTRLRVAAEARVLHFRSWRGEHEVDLIVEPSDHRVLGLEVKLSGDVSDRDVRHLVWLRDQLGEDFPGGAVLTSGTHAYCCPGGIAVIFVRLLGP